MANKEKQKLYYVWRTKYPNLRQHLNIGVNQAKLMGLPLRGGDARKKDTRTFIAYYCRATSIGPAIYEHWTLPVTQKKRKLYKATHNKNVQARNRNFVRRYKKLVGCTICGWNESVWGLHFDHINPNTKTYDISKMMTYSRDSIKKEMRKCRLICANCHSIHTQQQADSGQYSWSKGK